jgi:hypothetical protein
LEENARFRSLAEKLLAHPAFHPFLDELSRDPALAESLSKVGGSSAAQVPTPAPAATAAPKDMDPYSASQQFLAPQNNIQHVGMTLVPETHIDMSALSLGPSHNGWGIPSTNFQQVFAVTELPSLPESFDVEVLSGKGPADIISDFSAAGDEVKHDYPQMEIAPKGEAVIEEQTQKVAEGAEEECPFDENDPTVALFATPSRRIVKSESVQDYEPIFGDIPIEKALARLELVVTSEEDSQLLSSRLQRLTARLDASSKRLETLASTFM